MRTEINEPIMVAAVFSRGSIRPDWFFRSGRTVRIRETTYRWKTRQGSAGILHFSVTDGQGVYELQLNKETMEWRLAGCEAS